ncbi:MAG TPA: hypothetical protein VF342_07585 [Alphaproteobacteria bacterium]
MYRFASLVGFVLLAACAGIGTQKVSGNENQVTLTAADQGLAQRHCEAYGRDAVNMGQTDRGRVTYACRPRARSGSGT